MQLFALLTAGTAPAAPIRPQQRLRRCGCKCQRLDVDGKRAMGCSRLGRRNAGVSASAGAGAAVPQPGGEPAREVLQADAIIEPDGTVRHQPQAGEEEDQRQLWKAAIKAPMYSVGLAPILVSAAAAYIQTGAFDPARTAVLCVGAICIIAWLNLSNDVFDSATGVDESKPESVVNLAGGNRTGKPRVFLAASAFLAVGAYLLFSRLPPLGNPLVPRMLYAAIACGYLYQGPPFRWSYLGLGEPLCFIAFGPLATCAFYLAQSPPGQALTPMILGLSALVGLTTTIILFCSHFHQVAGDIAHNKMSPVVRLGMPASRQALKFSIGLTYIITVALSITGVLPFTVLTSCIAVYGLANETVKYAEQYPESVPQLRKLKMLATRFHIGFSLMLVLGLLIQKLM